jgi:hypothetical protein
MAADRAALAAAALLVAAWGSPGAQPAGAPSLAERIDLTRLTVLNADYTRASSERDTADLATYERELVAMLQDDVLAHVRPGPPGSAEGGTGGATTPAPRPVTPAVAVDEEEVGAASLEARVVDLSREFISLAGKEDDASLSRKRSILGSLQSISERAQFPSPVDPARTREGRQRAARERRERQDFENLPVK